MNVKIQKKSIRYLVILILLCLEHQVLYLVPSNWTILGLDYQTLCALFECFLFVTLLVEFKGKIPKSRYTIIFVLGIMLIVTSALAAMVTYGQGFQTGIIVQRSRVGSLLMFFVLLGWYKNEKVSVHGLWKTLMIFCTIYFFVCLLQFLLSDIITFTYSTSSEKTRYGSVRYWFSGSYLVFMAGFGLDRLWAGKKNRIIGLFFLLAPFVLAFVITKTRMMALALTCSVVICVIFRGGSFKKKMFGIVLVVIAFFALTSTQLGMDLLARVMNSGTTTEDTLTVRNIGRIYYITKVFNNPFNMLFGCGYASANNPVAYSMTYPAIYSATYGYDVMLYPSDNGIFGCLYYYGLLGILWWVGSLCFLFHRAWKIYKHTGNTVFIGIAIYEITSSLTLTPNFFSRFILVPVIAVLMLGTEINIQREQKNVLRSRNH